jgi:hypothetical protein
MKNLIERVRRDISGGDRAALPRSVRPTGQGKSGEKNSSRENPV